MNFRKKVDKALFIFLVFLMSFMVLNVLWQVGSRYIAMSPSSFTDELARYLLIWVGLLGASYVAGKKLHLAIDILPMHLQQSNASAAKKLNVIINVLVAIFALLVMVWGGIRLVYITLTLEQTSASLNIPLGYVYSVLPLSGLLIIYYSFDNLFVPTESPEAQGTEIF